MFAKADEPIVVIRNARNNHMAYPSSYATLLKLVQESKVIVLSDTCQLRIKLSIHSLDIQQHKICLVKHTQGIFRTESSTCVECCMQAFVMAKTEILSHKLSLHQRLATRYGNATVLYKRTVTQSLIHKLLWSHLVLTCPFRIPRIGIVTIHTTQGAALHKRHKAHTGTVNGSKRL